MTVFLLILFLGATASTIFFAMKYLLLLQKFDQLKQYFELFPFQSAEKNQPERSPADFINTIINS